MAHSQSAPGVDLEAPHRIFGPDITSHRGTCCPVGPMHWDLPCPKPDPFASALDRLIARIESGTATPEDVEHMPEGVLQYLDAVLALEDRTGAP